MGMHSVETLHIRKWILRVIHPQQTYPFLLTIAMDIVVFPTPALDIFYRFEDFWLYSLFKRWKRMAIFGAFRHFRWKLLTVSKLSDYIPLSKDGVSQHFDFFLLYILMSAQDNPRIFKILDEIPFSYDYVEHLLQATV